MADTPAADVVIITALALERDAVLRHLPQAEIVETRGRVFYRSSITTEQGKSYRIVVLPLTGMGTGSAAVATSQAVDVWNPQSIILTGITGGVRGAVKGGLGDVIVAEQIVGHEHAKVENGKVARRYEVFRPEHQLLVRAREFSARDWQSEVHASRPKSRKAHRPQVHFGVVASGDKVIADDGFLQELLKAWPKLLGVEMEGVGTALGAYQTETSPGVLFVKGVSDWADSTKDDSAQPYAADVAAAFTIAFLRSGPLPAQPSRVQAARVKTYHFSGKHKIRLCQRLGTDWYELADYFDIPPAKRRQFAQGRECQGIWEWLDDRDKLDGLPDALDFIERDDLAEILKDGTL